MVKRCAIKDCKTTAVRGSKVHLIPKGDRGQLWLQAIQRHQPDFSPTQSTIVCSLHFLDTDYAPSVVGEKLMLKKSALPCVFNVNDGLEVKQFEDSNIRIELTTNDLPETCINCSIVKPEIVAEKCLFPSEQSILSSNDETLKATMNNLSLKEISLDHNYSADTEIKFPFPKRKRKFYMNDFEEDDLNCPNTRKIYWYQSQETFKQQCLKIKQLRNLAQGLRKNIKTLESSIDLIKDEKNLLK